MHEMITLSPTASWVTALPTSVIRADTLVDQGCGPA